MNHWVVSKSTDRRGTYWQYDRVSFIPRGSLVLADELDGLSPRDAVRLLKKKYVSVWNRGDVIICRNKKENGNESQGDA